MPEVHCKVSVVGQEAFKVVLRCIVEGVAGCAAKLRNNVLQLLFFELGLSLEDLLLRRRQYAVDAAQHREREDDVLVLAAFESVADQVRNAPDKTYLFSEVARHRGPESYHSSSVKSCRRKRRQAARGSKKIQGVGVRRYTGEKSGWLGEE